MGVQRTAMLGEEGLRVIPQNLSASRVGDFVWMAGILDGEGCISIAKAILKTHSYPRYMLRIRVGVTEGQDLSVFRDYFGGTLNPMGARNEKCKSGTLWSVTANGAEKTLRALLPFLRWKEKQARLGIALQESLGGTHGNAALKMTNGELELRERLYLTLKSLNKRGPKEVAECELTDTQETENINQGGITHDHT